MNLLIDRLFGHGIENKCVEVDGKWYIAKPENPRLYKENKIGSAIAVLRGKAFAVHYKEDES